MAPRPEWFCAGKQSREAKKQRRKKKGEEKTCRPQANPAEAMAVDPAHIRPGPIQAHKASTAISASLG